MIRSWRKREVASGEREGDKSNGERERERELTLGLKLR